MAQVTAEESAYYQHTKSVPFASRISMRVRTKLFNRFISVFSPDEKDSVLDVGVTSDSSQQESNYFEQLYPYRQRITCVGTEDGSHLMSVYPGIHYLQVVAGKPLPFPDGAFDIVFSNAVVEHTGSREMQAFFMSEVFRVCRRGFFVTTPHRCFPVEHHTGLPLLHYLPQRMFRGIIATTRYSYWADEKHLNILSPRSVRAIAPADTKIETVRFAGIPTNVIAYGFRC